MVLEYKGMPLNTIKSLVQYIVNVYFVRDLQQTHDMQLVDFYMWPILSFCPQLELSCQQKKHLV